MDTHGPRGNNAVGYFCALTINQVAPDHSTLSRFRTAMTKAVIYDKLFQLINRQLEEKNIIVKKGVLVDASVIDTPLRPKGATNHKVTQDRRDEEAIKVEKEYPASVDKEAAWLKKGGQYHYDYKKHYVTDSESKNSGVSL